MGHEIIDMATKPKPGRFKCSRCKTRHDDQGAMDNHVIQNGHYYYTDTH